jgi:hypothetical protein
MKGFTSYVLEGFAAYVYPQVIGPKICDIFAKDGA